MLTTDWVGRWAGHVDLSTRRPPGRLDAPPACDRRVDCTDDIHPAIMFYSYQSSLADNSALAGRSNQQVLTDGRTDGRTHIGRRPRLMQQDGFSKYIHLYSLYMVEKEINKHTYTNKSTRHIENKLQSMNLEIYRGCICSFFYRPIQSFCALKFVSHAFLCAYCFIWLNCVCSVFVSCFIWLPSGIINKQTNE